jgi:WD40 repeat protein
MFAVGCKDGTVRLFEVGSDSPTSILKGHKDRAFNVCWNPIVPNVLASGSDDGTVRVWNITRGSCQTLEGHEGAVRGLGWCPEAPNMLASGSWDSSVRIWDVARGECTQVLQDHYGDVYQFTAHPHRPFLFVSASRDTTARFWRASGDVERLTAVAFVTRSLESLLSPPDVAMGRGSGDRALGLSGAFSQELQMRLEASHASDRVGHALLPAYRELSSFFLGAEGVDALWDLVEGMIAMRTGGEYPAQRRRT